MALCYCDNRKMNVFHIIYTLLFIIINIMCQWKLYGFTVACIFAVLQLTSLLKHPKMYFMFMRLDLNAASQHEVSSGDQVFDRSLSQHVVVQVRGQRSTLFFRFGEGAQLFGVDVLQLLQLPLCSSVQILDVHHVRLLDASVLSELITDSGDEAWFVLAGSQELSIQREDLLLQLTVTCHRQTEAPPPDQTETRS